MSWGREPAKSETARWVEVSVFGSRFIAHQLPSVILFEHVIVYPSGERLLTWGRKPWATVWDAAAGDFVCKLRGHISVINTAKAFARRGLPEWGQGGHRQLRQ